MNAEPQLPSLVIVSASVSRSAGGVSQAVRPAALALLRRQVDVRVLALLDRFTNQDLVDWLPLIPKTYEAMPPQKLGYSRGLRRALEKAEQSIVHQHGIWQLFSRNVWAWGKRTGRPVVISPHGSLDPWALRNSAWKKRIAMASYERRNFEAASCIHALNASEAASIRAVGFLNPVSIIPNGVELPADNQALSRPAFLNGDDRKLLLFLGRIHPKKGIVETLDAWSRVLHARPATGRDWTLVIAGWDDGNHMARVEACAASLGLHGHVHFPGPLFGADKQAALMHASAFVLASYSEGLPMAVLEAWAHRTPVFMTAACNLPEGFQRRCGHRDFDSACHDGTGFPRSFG